MRLLRVSVIVPVRNEEQHISNCLRSLLAQTYSSANYEVIVIDGLSSDRTKKIVQSFCCTYSNIRCLDNLARIVPCAMNIGIRSASGEIIVRADGHNVYPSDYIENCVKYLEQTKADNVGGPIMTVAADQSISARLVAAVLTSPFGVGNSRFRIGRREGFVETVPFGAFRKELFDRIGMYNERLARNQDNELNARIRQNGGKIYQTPALTTNYYPVKDFWTLIRTTFRTSQWHALTMRQNRGAMEFRHLIPAMFALSVAGLTILSTVSLSAFLLLLALLALHICAGLVVALFLETDEYFGVRCVLPFAFFCFHLSYGLGVLVGCLYLVGVDLPQLRSEPT